MSPIQIELRRMTQTEYEQYHEGALSSLVADLARAFGALPEHAAETAERSFASRVPEGHLPPDHHLYTVHDRDRKVGVLWFGIRRGQVGREAFVIDLVIEPDLRKRGYGEQAMLALEDLVRSMGIVRISLNAFEHNENARHLYERLGYRTISRTMSKQLRTDTEAG